MNGHTLNIQAGINDAVSLVKNSKQAEIEAGLAKIRDMESKLIGYAQAYSARREGATSTQYHEQLIEQTLDNMKKATDEYLWLQAIWNSNKSLK